MPTTKDCSVIIIVSGRFAHLRNVLHRINLANTLPREVIVVYIGRHPDLGVGYNFLIHWIEFSSSKEQFPYSEARNFGAQQAVSENLIFLDVDSIPALDFMDTMHHYIEKEDALIMGNPKYLKTTVVENHDQNWLENNSIYHPHRPVLTHSLERHDAYELFWSLCFAIRKSTFERLGGFDENYSGYGGEDTDFAFAARAQSIPFYLADAIVYHQQHTVYRPPFQHFKGIVNNSYVFFQKWKTWPMQSWLEAFKEHRLIEWRAVDTKPISILRHPTVGMLKASEYKDVPFA